ncbi:MAG: esterase/lipase family protein [Candidatus Helarchaeota archaeon]
MKKSKKFLPLYIVIISSIWLFAVVPFNKMRIDLNSHDIVQFKTSSEEIIGAKNGGGNKTLILIHGLGADSKALISWNDTNLYGGYYNSVVAINYYWDGIGPKPENYIGNETSFSINTNLSTIIDAFFNYLSTNFNFTTLDFLCHSLGGIITRGLICKYYQNLTDNEIYIDDIITMGTPNQGSLTASYFFDSHPYQVLINFLIYLRNFLSTENELVSLYATYLNTKYMAKTTQLYQIRLNSPFMESLNVAGDETPYDNNITWTTVAGSVPLSLIFYIKHINLNFNVFQYDDWERGKNILFTNLLLQLVFWWNIGNDGLVSPRSVILNGANNYVWNWETHDSLLNPGSVKQDFIINILIDVP